MLLIHFFIAVQHFKNTVRYFLHWLKFLAARKTFLNEITIVDISIIDQDDIKIIQIFLYGNPTYLKI